MDAAKNCDLVDLWIKNPMFACAGHPFCQLMANEFPGQCFEPDEIVVQAGQPVRGQFVVLDGMVRVFHRTADGRETVVKFLVAPATFGEMELLHHLPYLESVTAVSVAKLAMIPRHRYLELMSENPTVMMEQLRNLAGAFCVAARNELQILAPLEERVANLLLTFSDDFGHQIEDGIFINLALPKQRIAQSLGVTKRGIVNIITRWRESGLLRRQGDHLVLLQPDKLERIARSIRGSLRFSIGMSISGLGIQPDFSEGHLLVIRGPKPCLGRFATVGQDLLIGRAPHCSLLLPDDTVDSTHCRIYLAETGGRYWLEDLESLNGTIINGRMLKRRKVLHDGDEISLGATVLRFRLSPQPEMAIKKRKV